MKRATRVTMPDPSSLAPLAELANYIEEADQQGMWMLGCLFVIPSQRRILLAVNHEHAREFIANKEPKVPHARAIVEGRPVTIAVTTIDQPLVWLEWRDGDEMTTDILSVTRQAFTAVGDLVLKEAFAATENVNRFKLDQESPDA